MLLRDFQNTKKYLSDAADEGCIVHNLGAPKIYTKGGWGLQSLNFRPLRERSGNARDYTSASVHLCSSYSWIQLVASHGQHGKVTSVINVNGVAISRVEVRA